MYSNPIIEPSPANVTFAHTASDTIQRYTLHTLHARNEQRSISVDVIQITTSISGLLIAILGLIQGYRFWKQRKINASNVTTATIDNVDNHTGPWPANPNLVTIDINRICLDICKFYLSQIAPTAATQAVGAHDPAAGVELAPAAAQNVTIDEEERGLGPTSTRATIT
ncbi:hypothetical protein P167DRAFT_576810 [Morchella conica CCBAS932]|uniref:Uncharacterized protein n=1 Tax=Morchella conica CCBAS932 TaxID=1392247 RepID=A0A3N4KKM2_9PEZI|nr:hypothetical protein P167DRAFT_576810 [Morchella conica CCBAS932]